MGGWWRCGSAVALLPCWHPAPGLQGGSRESQQTTGLPGLGVAGLPRHMPPPRQPSPSTAARQLSGKAGEHFQTGEGGWFTSSFAVSENLPEAKSFFFHLVRPGWLLGDGDLLCLFIVIGGGKRMRRRPGQGL